VLMQIVESGGWTDQGIPYSMERVVEVWRDLRKVPKTRLKCEVSLTHGSGCFYANRGVGVCSDEVDLDRIIPERAAASTRSRMPHRLLNAQPGARG